MNLTAIKNVVTCNVSRQILLGKKHSPVILFGVGVAGFLGTVYFASKATLKLDDILEEANEKLDKIKAAEQSEKYSERDRKKDTAIVRTQTALKICKLYAPAFGIGVVTIAALTSSHIILTKRNAALSVAYAGMDKAFREYRGRVVADQGKEKDEEYRYDLVDKEVVEDGPNGEPVTKVVKAPRFGVDKSGRSMYSRFFAKGESDRWKNDAAYNSMFINAQQNWANEMLRARGHLFLNEVYEMLGFDKTSAGQLVGWVLGNGDGQVDFGVFDGDKLSTRRFLIGDEPAILLDFNVDGEVWKLLGD